MGRGKRRPARWGPHGEEGQERVDRDQFLGVDLRRWVYGTIEKVRHGIAWSDAWTATYREIGGRSESTGRKSCPMAAAKTLYEYGRIRNGGTPYSDCDIHCLWRESRNGTYAMLAIRLLSAEPTLNKSHLWSRIQHIVRCEIGAEPARSDQGGPTLVFLLWHQGLIVAGAR